VYARKVNTREELFLQILSAARSINNTTVLHNLQVLWLQESENVTKQMEDTLNSLLEC